MSSTAIPRLAIGVLAFLLWGCHGSEPALDYNMAGLPTLGELEQMNDASTANDTDGDGIKDDVEALLQTDPKDRDTDRDGLMDNYEIFGVDGFDPNAWVPDLDRDAIIAARDPDDDQDGRNDGLYVDTDGDSIPNYLEYYGYTYDWMTGQFDPWNGDPDVEYFRTDPVQPSTDQDPYSDAMEVSGAFMDVSVTSPGDHPLIPAYPNIVARLKGYAVTLNEDITYTEGASVAKGTSWSRQMTDTHSYSNEQSWDVAFGLGFEIGTNNSFGAGASMGYGESYQNTHSTSTAVSTGSSVIEEENWSKARSLNPSDAARIKLFLKVENHGSAPASNIVPTLTLKIGGNNVATFEPGNAQINMLVPFGVYPPEENVYWVVDSIDTGTGVVPLSLTMTELRALESGAPVAISMTQVAADVMVMDEEGHWQSAGDCNEYIARCDAVCANLRFDMGEGSFVHSLVYADDSPSAPPVSLRQALTWIGVDEEMVIHFLDKQGIPTSHSLEGWQFALDPETYRANGYDMLSGAPPTPGFMAKDMRLNPRTQVLVKPPRDPLDPGPQIHYAYLDMDTHEVRACISDYQGLARVQFMDDDETTTIDMEEDIPDSGYYIGWLDPETEFNSAEVAIKVEAESLSGLVVERSVGVLHFYAGPWAPKINWVQADLVNHRLYVNVESGAPDDPLSEVEWVKAFHPALTNGYVELDPVVDFYRDPHGYECDLPVDFKSAGITVAAYVAPGVYTEEQVLQVVEAHKEGSYLMLASIDTTGEDEEWYVPQIDLDSGVTRRPFYETDDWESYNNAPANYDVWAWMNESQQCYLRFNAKYVNVTEKYSISDFNSLTREQIANYAPSETDSLLMFTTVSPGQILAMETSEGRFAKVQVVSSSPESDSMTNYYKNSVLIKYVVFKHSAADAGDAQYVTITPTSDEVTVSGVKSVHARTFVWSFEKSDSSDGRPAGSAAALDDEDALTTTFTPDLQGAYHLKLVINDGAPDESADYTMAVVSFPAVYLNSDYTKVLALGERVTLGIGDTVGAESYAWSVVSQPAGSDIKLKDATTATPSFLPSVEGDYEIKLEINKGEGAPFEDSDTIVISVVFE